MPENATCSCGCGALPMVSQRDEAACGCECECCSGDRSREEEIAELHRLRESVEERLAQLGAR